MQYAFARQNATQPQGGTAPTALSEPPHLTVAAATLRDLDHASANPPAELMDRLEDFFASAHFKDCAAVTAKALSHFDQSPFLWDLLGQSHLKLANWDAAQTCLNKAHQLAPATPAPLAGLAEVCLARQLQQEAEIFFHKALATDEKNLRALTGLARLLLDTGRGQDARIWAQKAHAVAPEDVIVNFDLGNVLRICGDREAAVLAYARAVQLAPDQPAPRYNLAQMLATSGREAEALPHFEALLAQNPDDDRTRAHKLHGQAQMNDWRCFDEYEQHRRTLGLRGQAVPPFLLMGMEDNPDLMRVRSRAYAAEQIRVTAPPQRPAKSGGPRPKRLRIGYFSADFHNHATMHLMGGLFEQHDQSRFDIHAFSYGPDRADVQRQRLERNVTQFHDCRKMGDQTFIDHVHAQDLDIAVDLKGFTGRTRSRIFGTRLAPLQVSYLGYPGTLGSPEFDYVVTDPVVSPVGSEHHFDECLLRLPHCYQPNDDRRRIATRQFTRQNCGLPQDGFVFACFNNTYKITPKEFDIWMPLLSDVDGSVLWLLGAGPTPEANLRHEAAKRGVDPNRLIFADRITPDEHLARQRVADIFLDTFNYNAHTTGSDALWAGLPLVTLPGRQFSARVGASLLTAFGLPELIAETPEDYREIALKLAQDETALLSLRSRLAFLRDKAPLFDTQRYTRDLERGFDMIHDRYRSGRGAAHTAVPATSTPSPSVTLETKLASS